MTPFGAMADARVFRAPVDGTLSPLEAAGWLRDDDRPVALIGAWAGGGALLTSAPARRADPRADPFSLFGPDPSSGHPGGLLGGGWFGWLGFDLARRIEAVSPPPPGRDGASDFSLAFHDHLVRCDAAGRWSFEALITPARETLLAAQLDLWRRRLRSPPPPARPAAALALAPDPPGLDGHAAAVRAGRAAIAAGELSQVNLCARFSGELSDSLFDRWLAGVAAAAPAYAAYVGDRESVVASLSPELFLRRDGRRVVSRPVKGTGRDRHELERSPKDRAENVMIVDLVRHDLGRVCRFGSVEVSELCRAEPAAGVWQLVSTVQGELRPEVGDGALLRAAFPPGSVTGAPKRQALRVIHRLEAVAREAYCGAIGYVSSGGLELSVAIRTLEARAGRVWLGAGGAVTWDSTSRGEVDEVLAKARGVAAATGASLPTPPARRAPPRSAPPIVTLPRPDPARGLIETVLVQGGTAVALAAHLRRLRASARACGLGLPPTLAAAASEHAAVLGGGALRLVLTRAGWHVEARELPPAATAVRLRAWTLPGGLGAHKWRDRSLIDQLMIGGEVPLFCDGDGSVLEAGHAAVLLREGARMVAPPLDGRILPSISRARALAAAYRAGCEVVVEPFDLDRVRRADSIVLTSSLRGEHPARLA